MQKLRIILAEDHIVVREGLKMLLNAQPDMEVVGEADDGKAAVQMALEHQPDVLVMDISMPELSGAQATRQLKRLLPKLKILVLSVHADKSYLRELLKAGASGYVLKRAAAEELINAIHTVAKEGIYLDPSMVGKVVNGFVNPPKLTRQNKENTLSLRESEVVRLIAQGYTNKEIAAELRISTKTVETYKARAMDKIGLQSRADIVRYAQQHGWL